MCKLIYLNKIIKNLAKDILRFLFSKPLDFYFYFKYKKKGSLGIKFDSLETEKHRDNNLVDIVYTWVDDKNFEWQRTKELFLDLNDIENTKLSKSTTNSRFHNRDELKYSLRSVASYLDWVDNIYIVTSGHVPTWLNVDHPRINVIFHDEIFKYKTSLPTFNSHAIESRIHHIPGLKENYLYFNDDFFIGRYIPLNVFFDEYWNTTLYAKEVITPGLPTENESPLVWSIKNSNNLIFKKFCENFSFKLEHVPYGMKKSQLFELEKIFNKEFEETEKNKFRSINDVGVTTSLVHYYGLLLNTANVVMPEDRNLSIAYFNINGPLLIPKLKKCLYTRKYDMFCINEPLDPHVMTEKYDKVVSNFLKSYFPSKSEYEK